MSGPGRPAYDILALDLDGTLLNSRREVSEENRRAVARARRAGMRVCVCTGRGLVESRFALEAIDQTDPVVLAGGAIIACPTTNRSLHRFPIDVPLVERATELLLDRGHAALILKDALCVGYDYLVVQGAQRHPIEPVTRWWFEQLRVAVRYAGSLGEDEHPEHTVRVGACGRSSSFGVVKRQVAEAFGDQLLVMHFGAVSNPEHDLGDGDTLDVFEVFDRRANKWNALSHLAAELGVPRERIAAIGDEVNDESMIEHAGLGVAMANAVPSVRDRARHTTRSNDDHGVAYAVDRILSGEW
ncbi:MAG: HAD hydrolase family protein [Phycisphaeraceae bacterium]|nr:HAD hydrolase family protein [Phycisphaeraceae bacterium]